jgi:WD40 repeat protein
MPVSKTRAHLLFFVGTKLVLATRVSNSSGVLRLYDIQRKEFKKAHTKINLEPYRRDIEGEVHDAALSPDGVYLALGRHDNRTHVYDSRFLGKGVLYDFRHDNFASKTVPGAESCGVMKLQWVTNGSRLGLVSGGSDGVFLCPSKFFDILPDYILRRLRSPLGSSTG